MSGACGFGRCELVSKDVPGSKLLGAARLWGVVLGRGNCGEVLVWSVS